jgi:hypothetical protein
MDHLFEQVATPSTTNPIIIPIGLCQCGCGRATPLVKHNDRRNRVPKGSSRSYLQGHSRRKHGVMCDYVVEDRGYKTECWIWQRGQSDGYGRIWDADEQKEVKAHRYFYLKSGKTILDGLVLDHLCKVTLCVNPDHLEPVTNVENSRRAMNFRLDAEKVERIRHLHTVGVKYAEIGRIYNVSQQHVRNICLGRKWKCLPVRL